ncbi:MAG TPA: alpha/beta hydrolase [Beijerinckiaceae bacterium]|jgi:pimeloyl-ACP methyl ester carboxylesterase|nr:alpha/beta hydrolase [Beijerinckiaceae bacterium]
MTILLVHGAWAGAWSWRDTARLLRKQGFDVYAPSMTGIAERSHVDPRQVTLSTHIADISGLMRYEELENVLVVGHSYGGMVITGAVDREPQRVAGMVYLDAFLPKSGQALWDLVGEQGADLHKKAALAHDGGYSVPCPNVPPMPPELAAQWAPLFTPQPVDTLSEKWVSVRPEAQRTWPRRHYILCTTNKSSPFHQFADEVKGKPDWDYSEFDAPHDVVRSHPEMTANRIAEIARGWGVKE